MGQDAWRAYAEMALGMTEASRKKATKAVKRLIGRGGATADQLQGLAEELLQTSAANRDALTKLVRFELDRALGKVGLATADEVNELTARVRELEAQLREARTTAGTASGNGAAAADSAVQGTAATNGAEPAGSFGDTVAAAVSTPRPPTKKVAKKAVRPASPSEPGASEPVASGPGAAGGTGVAKKAPARKAPARRAPAKKVAPEKAAVKKAAPAKAAAKKAAPAKKAVPARSTGPRAAAQTARTAGVTSPDPAVQKAPARRRPTKRTGQP